MSYKIKEIPQTERPRERLKKVGAKNISDKELISIILKTGTKNKNVIDLAMEIIKQYKLKELREISVNTLMQIKGIGEVKAIELLASIELGRRIYFTNDMELKSLENPTSIYKATRSFFYKKNQECFYALYFNTKRKLIDKKLLFIGTVNQSIVHPREIFKEAYRLSASYIVCIHNHPTNDTTPSVEDIKFTEQITKTGKIQGIPVVDHLIVGEDNYYSFYEKRKNYIKEK